MSIGDWCNMLYELQERVGYDEWIVVSDPMPKARAEAMLVAFIAADDGGGEYKIAPVKESEL